MAQGGPGGKRHASELPSDLCDDRVALSRTSEACDHGRVGDGPMAWAPMWAVAAARPAARAAATGVGLFAKVSLLIEHAALCIKRTRA